MSEREGKPGKPGEPGEPATTRRGGRGGAGGAGGAGGTAERHALGSRWALVFVILAWLLLTIFGFVRVEYLVNQNERRIAADAALSRRLDKIDARETRAVAVALASRTAIVGAVVCNEQNRVKTAVRQLLQIELRAPGRQPALRRALHDLQPTDCGLLARTVIPRRGQ